MWLNNKDFKIVLNYLKKVVYVTVYITKIMPKQLQTFYLNIGDTILTDKPSKIHLRCHENCNNIVAFQSRDMPVYVSYKIIIYIRFASGDWVSLTQPTFANSSSLKMTVDLSLRSDTGNINRSPVSSMASSIIHPCELNQYIHIPGKKKSLFYIMHLILVIHFFRKRLSKIDFISLVIKSLDVGTVGNL